MCTVGGFAATCRDRIDWLVNEPPPKGLAGQPTACATAQKVLIRDCPLCSACSFAETECAFTADTQEESYECKETDGRQVAHWSPEERSWCCVLQGLGCPSGVAMSGFECITDPAAWGQVKKEWCCTHTKVGCSDGA